MKPINIGSLRNKAWPGECAQPYGIDALKSQYFYAYNYEANNWKQSVTNDRWEDTTYITERTEWPPYVKEDHLCNSQVYYNSHNFEAERFCNRAKSEIYATVGSGHAYTDECYEGKEAPVFYLPLPMTDLLLCEDKTIRPLNA